MPGLDELVAVSLVAIILRVRLEIESNEVQDLFHRHVQDILEGVGTVGVQSLEVALLHDLLGGLDLLVDLQEVLLGRVLAEQVVGQYFL